MSLKRRIRLQLLTNGFTQAVDVLTNAAPQSFKGSPLDIEIGAFPTATGDPLDLSGCSGLLVEIVDKANVDGARLFSGTSGAPATISRANWLAGTAQHAVVSMTETQTNLSLGSTPRTPGQGLAFYLVVSAVPSASGAAPYVLGYTLLTLIDPGTPVMLAAATPPDVNLTRQTADLLYAPLGSGGGGGVGKITSSTLFSTLPTGDWRTYLYTDAGDEDLLIVDQERALNVVHLGGNDGIVIRDELGGFGLSIQPRQMVGFYTTSDGRGGYVLTESYRVSLAPDLTPAQDAAADALDLAAGERVRRVVEVARAQNSISSAGSYVAWSHSGIVSALSSPGLRRLSLSGGDEDISGPPLRSVTCEDGTTANFLDIVLAALVAPDRNGSNRTGMTIDLRGNASSPTLDIPAHQEITCPAASALTPGARFYINDGTGVDAYCVLTVDGEGDTDTPTPDGSSLIIIPLNSAQSADQVASDIAGYFGFVAAAGAVITVTAPNGWGDQTGALPPVSFPAASSLVVILQSRGCTVLTD